MKVQKIVDTLLDVKKEKEKEEKEKFIPVKKGEYEIQIYDNDQLQGNIKRKDETVVCKFEVSNKVMKFYPPKADEPHVYDNKHSCKFKLSDDISKISESDYVNAKELYEILVEFAEKWNNK